MPFAETGNWRKTRSRIAVTVRTTPDADLTDLRRQLKAERLAEHIQRVVSDAPPLTEDQKAKLATLLRPASGSIPRDAA